MPCVFGVDPGTKGAIAVINTASTPRLQVFKFPTVKIQSGSKKRTRLDLDACLELCGGLAAAYSPDLCVIEEVNGFGGNANSTGAAGFVFGRAAGNIEAFIVSLQISRYYVSPHVWKKHFRLTGKGPELKTASRVRASQIFPEANGLFAQVNDDGAAEAALLADYGLREIIKWTPKD